MNPSSSFYQKPIDHILAVLTNAKQSSKGWIASCPVANHGQGHGDRHPSLSTSEADDGRVLLKCHAGCETTDIVSALGLEMHDLFPPTEGRVTPSRIAAPVQHAGCSLEEYAGKKQLPVEFLTQLGLAQQRYMGAPAVRIPYRQPDGTEGAVRYRIRMDKSETDDRFRWKKGAKPSLYGLERLEQYRKDGWVVLVEGESDCHTAWFHGLPAIGLPGATNWKEVRDAALLDGFDAIYVVIEPDQGGEAVRSWISRSAIRDRVLLVNLGEYKDLSAMHLSDEDFDSVWGHAREHAVAWSQQEQARIADEVMEARRLSASLAASQHILDDVADFLEAHGVTGERRIVKLLYLIVTSRVLSRPVSASIKGPSSSGKSYTLERVLELFPSDAYYALSTMSERALVYDTEPLVHRYFVLYEAVGIGSDFASYLIRSLLSEGHVQYKTVEKTQDGMRDRLIDRPGPTGFLTTTTMVHLHPENETRMLSIYTTDTQEQTARILKALANEDIAQPDLTPWHALQTVITHDNHAVTIPFAQELSDLVPPVATRLRRDFALLLNLIRAHAILHQATRETDEHGRIVATCADYAAVYELVHDLMADGVEATVSQTVRETVEAVERLLHKGRTGGLAARAGEGWSERPASLIEVASGLKLDKSAASRRVNQAIDAGYLRNLEEKRGRPARIILGDPLPEDRVLLPHPDALTAYCSDAGDPKGRITSLPIKLAPDNVLTLYGVDESLQPTGTEAGAPTVRERF